VIPVFDSFEWFASLFALMVVFVPLLLWVRPSWARQAVIAISGAYLLFLVAPRLAVFHLLFWLVVAGLQPLVSATGERKRGLWVLYGALAITLVSLVLWKVRPIEFVIDFNVWTHRLVALPGTWFDTLDRTAAILAPIGLSFSSFRAADLLIKSNLGLVPSLRPGRVLAYGLFAPLLVVGPIASYDEVAKTVDHPVRLDRERTVDGVTQVLVGLFKVFVIAYLLDWSGDVFSIYGANEAWRIVISLAAFTAFFYVNFAGYSDMAIGTGTLLGATLRPNFDRPFLQPDPTAFWNSWHISLTRFLRANVFTPLAAGRPQRQAFATAVTMMLIALWHAVSWATFVFGVYHAASLIAHRALHRRRPASTNRTVRVAKSFAIFCWFGLSLPLLQLGLSDAVDFYRAMIGLR
jgi:alginate O-acetyltransferase complex protein AlgI